MSEGFTECQRVLQYVRGYYIRSLFYIVYTSEYQYLPVVSSHPVVSNILIQTNDKQIKITYKAEWKIVKVMIVFVLMQAFS
jgi:hypothetical protein